jgi:hypothetical protein
LGDSHYFSAAAQEQLRNRRTSDADCHADAVAVTGDVQLSLICTDPATDTDAHAWLGRLLATRPGSLSPPSASRSQGGNPRRPSSAPATRSRPPRPRRRPTVASQASAKTARPHPTPAIRADYKAATTRRSVYSPRPRIATLFGSAMPCLWPCQSGSGMSFVQRWEG